MKKHSHHEHHEKKLSWILILSLSFMIAEIIGGVISGSLALIADAGHMFIDSLAVMLSLFAVWISHRPATSEKTFGYYRAEILAALLNGSTLIAMSLWIFYEAWHRAQNPHLVRGELMTVIAAGGLVVNLISLFIIHRTHDHNLNVRGVWLHLVTDTLGSVSAVIAGVLVWKWNWTVADPIISVVIGGLILLGAWRLVSDCVHVLLEAVPRGMNLEDVRSAIQSVDGVHSVHDLHVWAVASGMNSLSAHVRIKDKFEYGRTLQLITEMVSKKFGIDHSTIQIEPGEFTHVGNKEGACTLEH